MATSEALITCFDTKPGCSRVQLKAKDKNIYIENITGLQEILPDFRLNSHGMIFSWLILLDMPESKALITCSNAKPCCSRFQLKAKEKAMTIENVTGLQKILSDFRLNSHGMIFSWLILLDMPASEALITRFDSITSQNGDNILHGQFNCFQILAKQKTLPQGVFILWPHFKKGRLLEWPQIDPLGSRCFLYRLKHSAHRCVLT